MNLTQFLPANHQIFWLSCCFAHKHYNISGAICKICILNIVHNIFVMNFVPNLRDFPEARCPEAHRSEAQRSELVESEVIIQKAEYAEPFSALRFSAYPALLAVPSGGDPCGI